MRKSRPYQAASCAVLLAGWLALAGGHAFAEITAADGRVEASVRQLNATTGQTVDQAFEETPGTTNILPATATATLDIGASTQPSPATQPSSDGRLTATASVNPPAGITPENTKDFNIEASGLSLPADRGFACESKSTENRQVTLLASELDLRTGTRIRVRSTFVLSAGVFLVTLPESGSNVAGTVSFTVSQGSQKVLSGSVSASFDAGGQVQIAATGDASQAIAVPFDFSSQSSTIDQAHLILFPLISLPYEYDATVDEPFTLTAEVAANVNASSGAQGGSAFAGQVPTAFTSILDEFAQVDFGGAIGGVVGQQEAVSLADSQTEIIPLQTSRCGNVGLESLLGGLALTMMFVRRRFV